MGAKKNSRPITKKTHVARIPWIPEAVATALAANNFPTLGALKKGLETALPRGRIFALMKRNLDDLSEFEPLVRRINESASERRLQSPALS